MEFPEIDVVPRHECEFLLGASHATFERFCEAYSLKPFPIPCAGIVYRRSDFVAAVAKATADACAAIRASE
jgi:hypothetical protein